MARTFARRQFLQSLGGGATALLVAACAGGSPAAPVGSSVAAPKPAEKAAEKAAGAPAATASGSGVFWFNQPPQQEAFQKIIERFHQGQSKVTMEVVLVPGPEVPAKLATAIAG